ncbi:hypothetical protein I79_002148 [Cricetulus griseus]|uniref:Uncharacterized protein n=1 Tax=Cricetulus griseus TaxID=10029 RepID=G3GWM1_CRIGR|nr:hypothetical protein I79_002148 [Cricetulus griseus]
MEAGAADRGGAGRADPERTTRQKGQRPKTHFSASWAAAAVRTGHSRPQRQRLNPPRVCERISSHPTPTTAAGLTANPTLGVN